MNISGTNPSLPAPEAERHRLVYLLAVAAAMAALLWTLSAQDPWGWLLPGKVGIQIDQQVYLVPERQLERLSRTRPDWLTEAEAQALQRFEQGVERELDALFGRVHDRVPVFVDWYYSMPGVALRLFAAVSGPFRSGGADLLTGAVSERLFPDPGWQSELEGLHRAVGGLYDRELSALEDQWLGWLARELAPYRQDGPLPADRQIIDFDERLHMHAAGILGTDRIGMQMTAGLGAGALLARGAIARVNARAASARAAARLAGRGSAATGAAGCGLTGPLAIGCGVAVFTGITLGTEWALLKADEAFNRDDLERALHAGVDGLQETMRDEYGRPFQEIFASSLEALEHGVQGSLRPIDRIRSGHPEQGETAPARAVDR